MIQTKQLKLMKCMRVKSILKYSDNELKEGSVLFINTNQISNVKNKLGPIQIKTGNQYKYVLTDRLLEMQIGKKNVKKNIYGYTKKDFDQLKDEMPGIKIVDTRILSNKFYKNTLYYLNNVNTIFTQYSENISSMKKPTVYWTNIKNMIDKNFRYYPNKTMVINADEYKNTFLSTIRKKSKEFNPITLLYELIKYDFTSFVKLEDLDIIIVTNSGMSLRVNGPECFRNAGFKNTAGNMIASSFKRELFKLMNKPMTNDDEASTSDMIYNGEMKTNYLAEIILNKYNGITGEVPDNVKAKVVDAVEKAVDTISKNENKEVNKEDANDVEAIINVNKDILKEVAKEKKNKAMKSSASSKRDELLREKELELEIQGKTLGEILSTDTEKAKIKTNDISDKVDTINKNVTEVRFPNINKTYVEKVMQKDILSAVKCLSDKEDIKIYIRNIKVEDSSDINNYKEILIFEDNNITIKTNENIIEIKGENLIITKLEKHELLVQGKINKIEFR